MRFSWQGGVIWVSSWRNCESLNLMSSSSLPRFLLVPRGENFSMGLQKSVGQSVRLNELVGNALAAVKRQIKSRYRDSFI